MAIIDQVERLSKKGYSNERIARRLKIDVESIPAYKAHITRRKSSKKRLDELDAYLNSTYVVIPTEAVYSKLRSDQVTPFLDILDTLLEENRSDGLEDRLEENGTKPLPPSKVREIVLEDKRKGLSNEEVYEDPRLKRVDWTSIRSYLAHLRRGTYDKKR
tara:strand:+ start:1092 stop:1571 length:480 start_codon:yes stop_codon:yes gene_type:complete